MYNDEPSCTATTAAKKSTIEQAIGELSIVSGQIEDKIFLPCPTNVGENPMPESRLSAYRDSIMSITQRLRRVNDALGII